MKLIVCKYNRFCGELRVTNTVQNFGQTKKEPIFKSRLDMGFEKQVSSILENIRPDRQTLLLSATFAKRVEKVARSWLRDPVR